MNTLKKIAQYLGALTAISLVAFGLSRTALVSAQSSSNVPSGTFTCLINANYSGYNTKFQNSADQAINAILVFNFSSTVPNTGTLIASVINNVSNFETNSARTTTSTSLPYAVAFTIEQVTPASNVYKLTSDTPGDVPYYFAVTNGGNSLFIMSAPTNNKTHNGACQKA